MFRSLVGVLGLISVLAALVIAGVLMVNSFRNSLENSTPSGGTADSAVLRISGTPGVRFSGNYTMSGGSQNLSGTLGTTPTDYKLGGERCGGL